MLKWKRLSLVGDLQDLVCSVHISYLRDISSLVKRDLVSLL